jgi:cellulose synthase/poly-beta-1,6-N-acetylglucosamine synthase-like glycosyltransferase
VTQDDYPKISIIVASYNNQDTISECLQSILALDYPKDHFEVIVMDGVSNDKTIKIAKQFPVKVISIHLNCPAAYNYAFKIAAYPILGYIDSDAKVERNWLKKLVPHLKELRVAGVSGSIETWNQDNLWARAIGYELKNRYRRIGKYTSRIATMNLLLKKEVVEEIGGWDEKLHSQYDTDFGFRLSKKGYKIAYEPTAICFHYNRPTIKAYYRQQLQYGKNTLKLYFKHRHLAKGDEITDVSMNIQPILLLSAIVLLIVGLIPLLRLLWVGAGLILLGMFLYFTYSAMKISAKFHDRLTMKLIILYYVRSTAWFIGAVNTTIHFLTGREQKR